MLNHRKIHRPERPPFSPAFVEYQRQWHEARERAQACRVRPAVRQRVAELLAASEPGGA
jgi:hypothetical protein